MLYIVSTPIGNLKDITYRAIEVLSSSDYILAEDTKKSSILLNHYKIKKRLTSFHKFNEKQKEDQIIKDLNNNKTISLISSAGTPLISDPGASLIKMCIQQQIPFTAIPGACSVIQAAVMSGVQSNFQFVGFLEKKSTKKKLIRILNYLGTTIFFESPKRVLKTLQLINEIDKNQTIKIAKELTKKFEKIVTGSPEELIEYFTKKLPKGEHIFIISNESSHFDDLSLEELLYSLKNIQGFSSKDSLKLACKLKKIKKNVFYKKLI